MTDSLRPCPGGCDRSVPAALIACTRCTPPHLAEALAATDPADVTAYLDARAAIRDWFARPNTQVPAPRSPRHALESL